MLFRYLICVFPVVALLTTHGIPSFADSHDDALQEYIRQLPKLRTVQAESGTTSDLNIRPGLVGTKITGGTVVNRAGELALLKTYGDIIYPGAIVQGETVNNSDYAPIPLQRSGGTVSIVTNLVRGPEGGTYSADLPTVSISAVGNALKNTITELDATDSASTADYQLVTAGTETAAMVKLGVAVENPSISASVDAQAKAAAGENTFYVKFIQEFYRAVFEATDFDNPYFAPSVSVDQLKAYSSESNPPLYVSEVVYGRILILSFTTSYSEADVKASFEAARDGVSGSAAAEFRNKMSNMKMRIVSVGATGETASELLTLNDGEGAFDRLSEYIRAGASFNSRSNPGAPIAMKLRYLSDNKIAVAQLVTDRGVEVVDMSATKVCDDFSVFDGRGGGDVATDIETLPGDTLEITATGLNWSGVIGTGEYGPQGWDWDRPSGDAAGFPVRNMNPFGLVARVGATDRNGQDSAGQGADNTSSDGRGTWFYVGQGLKVEVGGRVDAKTPNRRFVPQYGQLYLSTNDDVPTNGNPDLQFAVEVCLTPSNP